MPRDSITDPDDRVGGSQASASAAHRGGEVEQTVRMVVGPDEPSPGCTRA
jgi:hypothetical protein